MGEDRKEGKEPMSAKWGICVLLVALLGLAAGCRTPQPNLKPEKTAERLVGPPPNTYMASQLPKQAFSTQSDPAAATLDAKNNANMMPTRGSMMPGSGGMGPR